MAKTTKGRRVNPNKPLTPPAVPAGAEGSGTLAPPDANAANTKAAGQVAKKTKSFAEMDKKPCFECTYNKIFTAALSKGVKNPKVTSVDCEKQFQGKDAELGCKLVIQYNEGKITL